MNKQSLIKAVKVELGVTAKEAEAVIGTVVGAICNGAIEDGKCAIPGLGNLVVKDTKARPSKDGVSPQGVAYTSDAVPAGKKFALSVLKEGKARLV